MRKSRVKQLEQEAQAAPSGDTLKLPHDPVGEGAIIAAVIVSPEARRKYLSLPSSLFFGTGHAEAWEVLQQIFERGLTYDPVTVRQLSGGLVDPDVLDGYISVRPELPPNLTQFVDNLKWDATRIGAAKVEVAEFLEAMRDPRSDPDKVMSLARSIPRAFEGHGSRKYLRSTDAIVAEHSKVLTKRREGHASYPFGLGAVDFYGPDDYSERPGEGRVCLNGKPRLVPGAGPGMLTVVTGVSGSGKTTSVAGSILYWAQQEQITLWGAWEVKDGPSLELLAAMSLGWSRTDVMTGDFSAAQQAELEAEMIRLGEWVKFLELPFGRRVGERGRQNERNLDLLQQSISDVAPDHAVFDLFQRSLTETKPEDEAAAVYRLQAIGIEEKTHIVAVHQVRLKDLEQRDDKRPTRESLKGSAAYVEAADTILAWYRPHLYKSVPDTKIECHILKQRYGKWPQVVELDWDAEFGIIQGGKTIEVERPGEQGQVESFLGDAMRNPNKKSKRGKRYQ